MFLCISVRVCSDMSNYREKTSQRVAALYRSGHDIKWSEEQVDIYIYTSSSIDSLLVNASTLLPSIFQSESRLFGQLTGTEVQHLSMNPVGLLREILMT